MAIKQDKISFKKDVFGKNASSMPDFENHASQTQKNTTCYMCACRCGIKVTLENNKAYENMAEFLSVVRSSK